MLTCRFWLALAEALWSSSSNLVSDCAASPSPVWTAAFKSLLLLYLSVLAVPSVGYRGAGSVVESEVICTWSLMPWEQHIL